MAQVRDILIHVSVDIAIRARKCHRSAKHKIEAGERHILIREAQGLGAKNYCKLCAHEILTIADGKLKSIIGELAS